MYNNTEYASINEAVRQLKTHSRTIKKNLSESESYKDEYLKAVQKLTILNNQWYNKIVNDTEYVSNRRLIQQQIKWLREQNERLDNYYIF